MYFLGNLCTFEATLIPKLLVQNVKRSYLFITCSDFEVLNNSFKLGRKGIEVIELFLLLSQVVEKPVKFMDKPFNIIQVCQKNEGIFIDKVRVQENMS